MLFLNGYLYAGHMQSNCSRFLPFPSTHPRTQSQYVGIHPSKLGTPMTKTKVAAPLPPPPPTPRTLYTPANVWPTISLPHNLPSFFSLRAIQLLNSSMVMLALASFNSMLPGW